MLNFLSICPNITRATNHLCDKLHELSNYLFSRLRFGQKPFFGMQKNTSAFQRGIFVGNVLVKKSLYHVHWQSLSSLKESFVINFVCVYNLLSQKLKTKSMAAIQFQSAVSLF